jgi:hypothetical protein
MDRKTAGEKESWADRQMDRKETCTERKMDREIDGSKDRRTERQIER